MVEEAAANRARLVVFGEAFVAGYPDWVWRRPPWRDDDWYALGSKKFNVPIGTPSSARRPQARRRGHHGTGVLRTGAGVRR